MDTQSTAAEGRLELGEKYRRWKETYLPAGDTLFTYTLVAQLEALGDERLVCANMMSDSHLKNAIYHLRRNIAMAKLQYGQTSLSLLSLRYLEDEANDRGLNHETSEPF